MKRPLTQEQLVTIIDSAIDLYQHCQPIKGMLPNSVTLQAILKSCGLTVELDQIRLCRERAIQGRSQ